MLDVPQQMSVSFNNEAHELFAYHAAEQSYSSDDISEDELEYADLSTAIDYLEAFVDTEDFNDHHNMIDSHALTVADSSAAKASEFVARVRHQDSTKQTDPEIIAAPAPREKFVIAPFDELPLCEVRTLEDSFCRNFSCCGLVLLEMHELLQHYEERHVVVESAEDSDLSEFSDSDMTSEYQFVTMHQLHHHTSSTKASSFGGKSYLSAADMQQEDYSFGSAFHNSILSPSKRSSQTPACSLVRRVGDVEDDLGARMLDLLHEEYERGGKRLKMMEDANGGKLLRGSDGEVDVVTIDAGGSGEHFGCEDSSDVDFECKSGKRDVLFEEEASCREDKPYRCVYPGCDKAYKNANGLKYHNLHGHSEGDEEDSDFAARLMKPYICSFSLCHKRYKNLNGLKYHIEKSHVISKPEANQIATNIVKKTNSRYGINSRNVPAPVLFAAIKEHEARQKGGAESIHATQPAPESSIRSLRVTLAPKVSAKAPEVVKAPAAPAAAKKMSVPPNYAGYPQLMNYAANNPALKSLFYPQQQQQQQQKQNKMVPGQAPPVYPPNMPLSTIPAYVQALFAAGFLDLKNFPVVPQQQQKPQQQASMPQQQQVQNIAPQPAQK